MLNNHPNSSKDSYLVDRFAALKIPWWVKLFPVVGYHLVWHLYKSWFFDSDDKYHIWKQYRWIVFSTGWVWTGSAWFFASAYFAIVQTLIYFVGMGETAIFAYRALCFSVPASYFALNVAWQYVVLTLLPKRVSKNYYHNSHPNSHGAGREAVYDFDATAKKLKTDFFKISYFGYFAVNDSELRSAWLNFG